MWTVLLLVVVVVVAVATGVLLHAIALQRKRRRYSHIPGPPLSSFYLGHTPMLREIGKRGMPFHDWLSELVRAHGPVFVLWFCASPVVFLCDSDGARDVLTCPKSAFVYNRSQRVYGARFLGNGLANDVDRDRWRRRRHAIASAFTRTALKRRTTAFNESVDRFVDRLANGGETIRKMKREFPALTLDAIARVAFGSTTRFDAGALLGVLQRAIGAYSAAGIDPYAPFSPWKNAHVQNCRRACVDLRRAALQIVRQRVTSTTLESSALDRIVQSELASGRDVTNEENSTAVDDVATLLVAGFDPVSVALTCAVSELSRNRHAETKLIDEIDSVLGDRKHVTLDDVSRLVYTGCVFKEVLRLCPPAYASVRTLVNARTYAGVAVPAGSDVAVNFFALHRQEKYWKDPDAFDPDRFASPIHANAFMPFSGGERVCAGNVVAEILVKMTLARLYQTFRVRLVDEEEKLVFDQDMILRPRTDLLCRVEPRSLF